MTRHKYTWVLAAVFLTVTPGLANAQALPPGARLRLGSLDLRHTDPITAVAFPADGKTLISSAGGEAILWDLQTGKERRHEKGPLLALSPDGKTMALGKRTITLVDAVTGKPLSSIQPSKAGELSLAFSAKGDALLTGHEGSASDVTLRLWETASGKQIRQMKTKHYDLKSVALSSDGNTFFSLGGLVDARLQLWDAGTGKKTYQQEIVSAAVYSADGSMVFAATGEGAKQEEFYRQVIALDTVTGKKRHLFQGSDYSIAALALSPDGKTLAVAGSHDVIRLWDLATQKQIQWLPWVRGTPEAPWARGSAQALAFSRDGTLLAAGGWGNTVRLWDWRTGKELFDVGHHAAVGELVFSPDGKALISRGLDDTIRVWEMPAGKESQRFAPHPADGVRADALLGMLLAPDAKSLVLGSWTGELSVLDLKTGKERLFKESPPWTKLGGLSTDGKTLLTFIPQRNTRTKTEAPICQLWDIAMGEKTREFPLSAKVAAAGFEMTAAALAPDGKTVAAAWFAYKHRPMYVEKVATGVCLLDAATGKERHLPAAADSLLFLDGGKTLVCVGNGMQFWDVATGKKVRDLGWGTVVAVSPNGKLFACATGARDGTISVCRTATGEEIHHFKGHRGPVRCLAFSPDGRMLASGSDDTTIMLWETILLP
jgi:WD40 repeat protein